MSDRRSLVVGHRGQDGRLLVARLLARGDRVLGADVGVTEYVGEGIAAEGLSLADPASVARAVGGFQPHELYYLAAHHRSSQEASQAEALGHDLLAGMTVNVTGLVHCLEAMRVHAPATRLFYASSSLIFGVRGPDERQNEDTPWTPACEYGLQKALGMQACRLYRERCGLFAACGILYNHESALRPPEFLSKKVVLAALRISRGSKEQLLLGDLDGVTDWSYAPDFVDAFLRILALDLPQEFIVASGEGHTVREFVEIAFAHLGLDWQKHVVQVPGGLLRVRSERIGNPEKLRDATGWRPSLSFEAMVRRLVEEASRAEWHQPTTGADQG